MSSLHLWMPYFLVLCLGSIGCSRNDQGDPSIAKQLTQINEKLDALSAQHATVPSQSNDAISLADSSLIDFHTTSEAKELFKKLGEKPSATQLANALNTVDAWPVKSEQEKEMRQLKLGVATQLRKLVKEEVIALQKAALESDSGNKGVKKHAAAGSILALYPMSEESSVIEEAKLLAGQQADVALRLEVIRRQRYNHWAAEQVEKAISDYNNTKSRIPFKTDRDKLVVDLVNDMGPVDPALLEPTVLELYNYAVNLTKEALWEAEKIELAKKMTDPTIKRKTLGDF